MNLPSCLFHHVTYVPRLEKGMSLRQGSDHSGLRLHSRHCKVGYSYNETEGHVESRCIYKEKVVVICLLFCGFIVQSTLFRSFQACQLTYLHCSWARLDRQSGKPFKCIYLCLKLTNSLAEWVEGGERTVMSIPWSIFMKVMWQHWNLTPLDLQSDSHKV